MPLSTFFAYHPEDSDERRLEKFAALLVSGSCCIAGILWCLMYYLIFGSSIIALFPALFVLFVGSAIFIAHKRRNHFIAVYVQIFCITYVPVAIQWSIGGIFTSGFVIFWSLLGPITALMFLSLRQSTFWLILYLINLGITVVFNDYFTLHGETVDQTTRVFFVIMNLGVSSIVVFIFSRYFVASALREREKSNHLLLNILPRSVAINLKRTGKDVAQRFENVTVLFADIGNFTKYSTEVQPEEVVSKLDEIFSGFDDLTEKYGLEKIKTIGDAYMVVGGIPHPKKSNAADVTMMGLEMLDFVKQVSKHNGEKFSIRIGVQNGPVVAGVIGKNKFAYDLWGDTVNTASRLESAGELGKVNVSERVHRLLENDKRFQFAFRGKINAKGVGEINMYFVEKAV